MKLLFDTQVALWFPSGSARTRDATSPSTANQALLSAAVVWEIAIKRGLGKLVVPDEYLSLLLDSGVQALAVRVEHAAAVEALPMHHRDPFDRMLVAQAQVEGAAVISRDQSFREYGVTTVW